MKLFVLILSCHKFPARREACRETWLPRLLPNMQYRFYVGEGPSVNEPDVVQLSISDSYDGLRDKTPEALRHALQFEWDWLLKCDDDVYVVPERLEDALKSAQLFYGYDKRETRPHEPHYVGCVTRPPDFYGYGGAYFLDRWLTTRIMRTEAEDRIKHADMFNPSLGEDGWIGHLARKHVRYWMTDALNNNPEPVPTLYNNLATCHRKDPIAMRQAHLAYTRV
jgi:hypothetical protein